MYDAVLGASAGTGSQAPAPRRFSLLGSSVTSSKETQDRP